MNGKDLYGVYGSTVDFKNFQGNPMPEWEALPDKIKMAWDAVAEFKTPYPEFDNRETGAILHAMNYADHYAEAGIPGHSQLLLIAKLAKALGMS